MNDKNILIDFASRIGRVEKGLSDLTDHFTNHLSQHTIARLIQCLILVAQVVTLVGLGIIIPKVMGN